MTNVFCCPLDNLLTIIMQFFQIRPQFRSVYSNRIIAFDIEHWRERFFEVKAVTDSQGNTCIGSFGAVGRKVGEPDRYIFSNRFLNTN